MYPSNEKINYNLYLMRCDIEFPFMVVCLVDATGDVLIVKMIIEFDKKKYVHVTIVIYMIIFRRND